MSVSVVVADDDARMRQFYERILSLLGHRVLATASDGEELLVACIDTQPELVISDIRMPKVDGIAAAEAVLDVMDIPFIFVSAYHDAELIDRVSGVTSYGYLVKPIKKEDLETAIPIAVKRHSESR